jgi:hypothetical protein
MAGLLGKISWSGVSLTAATAKSMFIATAPANQRLRVLGYAFSFNGTTNSNTPVLYVWQRASAAGTSTAFTPIPHEDENTETFQGTYGINATVEPTYTANKFLDQNYVHPQLGKEVYFPQGQELLIKGGGFLGLQLNAPQAVSCSGFILIEE